MSEPDEQQWETIVSIQIPESIRPEHHELFRAILEQRLKEKALEFWDNLLINGDTAK